MTNGICARQNEDKSISMLAAQRQLYNEVGYLDYLNLVLLVVLPLIFAILQEAGAPWSWIRFLSYGLSLAMVVISIFITRECKSKKTLAASIQMAFDVYVYSMPWDKKLFGKQKNYNAVIAEKSKKILNNEIQKNALKDWYMPAVDQMTLEKGILACQKENYHWDGGLRKRYRGAACFIIALLAGIIFVIGIVKNEPTQELVTRFIFILPMVRWLANIINGLNDDLERLKELDNEFSEPRNKAMSELQMIQKIITENRKSALKIPNIVYRMFKDNDEDLEHKIETMDAEQT